MIKLPIDYILDLVNEETKIQARIREMPEKTLRELTDKSLAMVECTARLETIHKILLKAKEYAKSL